MPVDRRRYADDDCAGSRRHGDVGRQHERLRSEVALQALPVGVQKVGATGLDDRQAVFTGVAADDCDAGLGECDRGGQADISHSDDRSGRNV